MDGLKAACRRLLAGGGWVTTAEAEAALAAEVPTDLARKTWDRLARVGCADPGTAAGRLAAGAARVVRERMQRLASDGEAEAVGDGADRKYRLKTGGGMGSDKPRPKREYVPLDRLTFDPRLQMRVTADGKLYDEPTAERYHGFLSDPEDPASFPELDVVDDGKKLWVIGGFNRGEAYRRAGVGSVACHVYEGTFEDARLWALSENSRTAKTRTDADCRKAFDALVGDDKLRKRVLAGAKAVGGVHRAICKATGLSHGAVDKYLKAAGLKATRDGKLVPADPKPAAPKPSPARASGGPPPTPAAPPKTWKDEPAAEAIQDHAGTILPALAKEGIGTLGELAAVLLTGRTLFLGPAELDDLRAVVAEASKGGPDPVTFPDPVAFAADTLPFTVPPTTPAPHGLDLFKDAAKGGSAPGEFAAVNVAFGQVLTALRTAATGLEHVLTGRGGTYLRRVTVAGRPLFELRRHTHRGSGQVSERWACALLDVLARALTQARVEHVCAACQGKGCPACQDAGFVCRAAGRPGEPPALDFGDPWDQTEGGE